MRSQYTYEEKVIKNSLILRVIYIIFKKIQYIINIDAMNTLYG